MRCRNCGHDNKRNTGKCDNCGFRLESQVRPMKEQRAALQKPLKGGKPQKNRSVPDLLPSKKSYSGMLGLLIFIVGAAGAFLIVSNFEQSEYEEPANVADIQAVEVEIPVDSLLLTLGTDIVYVFNEEGTSASPRANFDLSLIPADSRVSFLGRGSMSIQPVVNYMLQKIRSNDFKYLVPDSLFAWVDSTETDYLSVPILRPFDESDTTAVLPVEMKLLFTEDWLGCTVEDYNIEIAEPVTAYEFNARLFSQVISQAERTVSRRNTDERPVQVTLLFPSESTFGDAMHIAESVSVVTDSLGYQGFLIKWVNVTD